MIRVQNITVETFSYIFKDPGIFVFENSASGTLIVIAVVKNSNTCSNTVAGISAAMKTDESLAAIGIKSYNKTIKPNWWFIIISFVLINGFFYITIYCFIKGYDMGSDQKGLLNND